MEIIEAGILTPFEVTFIDTGLFVQAWVYDTTTGTPVGPTKIAMTEITPGTYVAYFTPVDGKTYVVVDRVFTDGTYATLDPDYPPNSEAAQAILTGGGGGSTAQPCGLTVILSSSQLNVILDESELVTELDESELDVEVLQDFLTVIFPCEG